jgi:chloride channel 3/4/5
MFELTGQLNLVVPCMFTLTITKFIASLLSRSPTRDGMPSSNAAGGFFDSIIRMKGFPYLDNKDDYNIGTSVKHVMTSWTTGGLIVLDAGGTSIAELDNILKAYDFYGYPVVRRVEDAQRTKGWTLPSLGLVGYITKQDLEFALAKVRSNYQLTPTARIVFGNLEGPLSSPMGVGGGRMHTGVIFVDASRVEGRNVVNTVDFKSYMDAGPLTIHPELPVETCLDLFKKLGCKLLLVTQRDFLVGIVTKKDVLRVLEDEIAKEEEDWFVDDGGRLIAANDVLIPNQDIELATMS